MVKKATLKSGVTVVMEPLDYVGSCALGIWVKTGSVNETADNSGISHFIEHMMFKGTARRDARKIAEDMDNLGGQINAFTGKEATCYYIKTLSSNLSAAMEVLFDMFTNSTFDRVEMDRERNVIKEEMKMTQDTPDEDVQETILELVFSGKALGKSIIGTNVSLDAIGRREIIDYMEHRYTADNVVVSVAGNFDEEEVCAAVEKAMATMNKTGREVPYKETSYQGSFKTKVKDIEQSHISLAVPTIALEDDNRYAYSLLSSIMGGSMSSRFFQNIRERKGLAYSVYSVNTAFAGGGYYDIYAGVAHHNVENALEAIKEELGTLKKSGVTKEELNKVKEQMKSGYMFGQESVNNRMFSLGKAMTLQGRTYTQEEVRQRIDNVTMEDIHLAAETITNMDNYSGVLITNKDVNLESLVRG